MHFIYLKGNQNTRKIQKARPLRSFAMVHVITIAMAHVIAIDKQ